MKQFFLFQKGAKGLSIPRQVSFWLYHGVLYLLANVGLGIGSLWFCHRRIWPDDVRQLF